MTDKEKELKRVKRLVREGKIPAYHFAKGPDGKMEREPHRMYPKGKLTWRVIGTVRFLGSDQ